MKLFLCPALLFLLAPGPLTAGDWLQFRGPNGSGLSAETVPDTWSRTENLVWKLELPGPGSSSPIVAGDAVFVTCYTGEPPAVERHLLRVAADTGTVVWRQTIPVWHPEDEPKGFIMEHGWASNTPVSDGRRIYLYAGKAGVHAFDLDGKRVWKAETGAMSSRMAWGSASSPILNGEAVIVPAGDETRSILALHKDTGAVLWKAAGAPLEQTYGSPVVAGLPGGRTDLVFAGAAEIWGINPATGKLRWFATCNLPGNMSNTPVIAGDILTISGGYPRTARVALRLGGSGDLSGTLLYDTEKPATYMTAPVLVDGVLYWVSDDGIAFAAKPGEAEPLWMERLPDLTGAGGRGKPFYASPVVAGGKIIAVSRANGTYVLKPDPAGLKVLAHNKFDGDETAFNATPAVSGGKLFLRSQTHLYGIGAKERKAGS
jgi:outer membrane protein assembly factor BamB